MQTGKRLIAWVASLVGIILIGLLIWEPLIARQMPPPPLRSYDVRIVRDEFGVPHIFGKSDADAAYGLGYAHSEDDFATIQEVIAMTRGRFGAMIGSEGAKIDYVGHLLSARETVDRDYAKIPLDVRAVIEAYAAGLNRYAAKHSNEVRLAKLFPVTGPDVATGFVLRSPFFFGLDRYIGNLTGDKPPPVDSPGALTPAGRDPAMNGSNAFAVAPKRMADGKTWLISNSHQPYEGSVAWYEAVMHSDEGLDMAGALFPGSPFILLGHNRDLGWTNTVNHPDLIDVYRLTLDDSGTRYRFDGKWLPLQSRRVWLPVKFGPLALPVPMITHRSVHGPVIINKSGAFAIRYAGIDQARMLEQYFRITKARDWDEWRKVMSLGGITATNFIYADKTGKIAFIYHAQFPPRKPGFDYQGVLRGDTSANLWRGALPFSAMPQVVDPPSGFVINANNTPFLAAGPGSELDPKAFSPLMGIEGRVTNRAIRSIELLAADPSLTPQELLTIKFDTAYSRQSFVGQWLDQLARADFSKEPDLARAQALIATWDWKSDGVGVADAIAEGFIRGAAGPVYNGEPLPDVRTELRKVVDYLTTHFGRIDVPLLTIQRLRRGQVDLGVDGGTDTLRAATIWDRTQTDHKFRVRHGDSFIMTVAWDKSGRVESQSIQPYGAATTRPKSPHYTDQMARYVAHKFKPVHFARDDLMRHAAKEYTP